MKRKQQQIDAATVRRQVVKPGDVLAIRLDGIDKVAYARMYEEGSLAVYADVRAAGEPPPLGQRRFLFQVAVYAPVLRSGVWPKVARDPFVEGEDEWPWPRFVRDQLSGEYSLYYRGEQRSATRAEVEGLEPVAAWDRQHVEERIVAALKGLPQPWVNAPWEVGMLDLSTSRTRGTPN